jgi:hypothetical protein
MLDHVTPTPPPDEPVSPLTHHSGAEPLSVPRRRSGREGPQALTDAFSRYAERVRSVADPTPRSDLHAALGLAAEIAGRDAGAVAVDPSAIAVHAPAIRQLARGVRQAGRGAVAHPALLARAIVLARALAAASSSASADGRADARDRRVPARAAR